MEADQGGERQGDDGCVDRPAQEWIGTGLVNVGWIQTPVPSLVGLTGPGICVSHFAGTDPRSSIGKAATQHDVRGILSCVASTPNSVLDTGHPFPSIC